MIDRKGTVKRLCHNLKVIDLITGSLKVQLKSVLKSVSESILTGPRMIQDS